KWADMRKHLSSPSRYVRVPSPVAGREQFHHCLWTQAHTQNYNHIALTNQAHDTASSASENPAQFAKAAPAAGFLSAGFLSHRQTRYTEHFPVRCRLDGRSPATVPGFRI